MLGVLSTNNIRDFELHGSYDGYCQNSYVLRPGDIAHDFQPDAIELPANNRSGRELKVVDTFSVEVLDFRPPKVREVTCCRRDAQRAQPHFDNLERLYGAVLTAADWDDAVPPVRSFGPIAVGDGCKFSGTCLSVNIAKLLEVAAGPAYSVVIEREVRPLGWSTTLSAPCDHRNSFVDTEAGVLMKLTFYQWLHAFGTVHR